MIGFYTVPQGERAAVWRVNGAVRYTDGPRRMFLFRERPERLRRFSAEPDQFLIIRQKDGTTVHLPGPASTWFDPVDHLAIEIGEATKIDANEALVVYHREPASVSRRIIRGPALFVPTPEEWTHQFRWHGSDAKLGNRKIPNALQFTKLRVIPDQMYFDVENVRTADDALLIIKVMVFFELVDIEKMLDQTHDPIADFINALSADVVDFVGGNEFDAFKGQTDALNQLATYPQLIQRAEKIGYRISKVVYRGYYASDKLQAMHDGAIECRTKLHLEAETERQAQELADMKLTRELERTAKRQQMEEGETRHGNHLKQLQHDEQLRQLEVEQKQTLEARRREEDLSAAIKREQNDLTLNHERAMHEEQAQFFSRMRELQVDLTRYLVAQYQNPDKVIRIDQGQATPQLHLHET
ncbi:hypothetical protein DB345_09910 [Spartobacteria bacterium LR76]|nr:hypothetical protein DB345_09910 [Spartobacteria bacterium LR76]